MYIDIVWAFLYTIEKRQVIILAKTQAEMQAQYRYAKQSLHRVPLDLFHKDYETLKAAADGSGLSVNGYVKEAIREKMERDHFDAPGFLKSPREVKTAEENKQETP